MVDDYLSKNGVNSLDDFRENAFYRRWTMDASVMVIALLTQSSIAKID